MKKIFLAIILSLVVIGPVSGEEIINGTDFDAIPWDTVCPNIQPMQLQTPSLTCDYSHPASPLHRYKVIATAVQLHPNEITCDYVKEEFKIYTAPVEGQEGHEWDMCRNLIKMSYKMRLRKPEEFSCDANTWLKFVLTGN